MNKQSLKALKSHTQIERHDCLRSQIDRAKHTAILLLALVGVMTVAGQTVVLRAQTSTGTSIPGDLNARRAGHKATLLTTGKVIIVGGYFGSDATGLSDTELFDPETGTWSVTGNTLGGRSGHTATLLADGKVLAAAGEGVGDVATNSTELYDPATGKWSATGNLITARLNHTATLLPDGRVLIVGGFATFTGDRFTHILNSVELYDPTTGTWSETGKLNTHRYTHTATLLENGKVLVSGGVSDFDSGVLDSAELYDPDTGTWSTTGKLNTPRGGHTATLLQNGKILVAGGEGNPISNDEVALISSAELYDPVTGTWKTTGGLKTDRPGLATLLHNGKVLVAGYDAAQLYDPETETWSLTARLNAPRHAHTTTLLPDGRVLAAGGAKASSSGLINSSELYDSNNETWTGPVVPVITGALVTGKRLILFGENFGPDAEIWRNRFRLKTKVSGDTRKRVAKKGAVNIKPGDKLQVLNPSGALSQEFTFTTP